MNMKQGLIVLTLLMALSVSVPTLAQKHRHTPQGTELVDTTHNSSAVDAFSDTTTVDTVAGSNSRTFHYEWDSDNDEDVEKLLSWMDSTVEKHTWAAWTIAIIVIIFVFLLLLSPIIFIILLIWLVGRNRKQKVQMAQMAMEKGQPIPDQVLQQLEGEITDEYQKGLRQCFVGVGLAIFLGLVAEEVGFGIGALVFFIGLGKVIAAKTASKNTQREKELNNNNNNSLNSQDYD